MENYKIIGEVKEEVYNRIDTYKIIKGTIPNNYSIWNAHLLKVGGKTYLKLYNNDKVVGYSVDMDSLFALEVSEELGNTIDRLLAGGRNPQEVKNRLNSKDSYFRNKAKAIKPFIESLYNVEIK
jgi:hypothetical protein